jgi:hypothetical protein
MESRFFCRNVFSADKPAILIVEGVDDAYMFDALLTELGASEENVRINIANGKDKLAQSLKTLVKSSGFVAGTVRKYAVVRDADGKYADALTEMKTVFASNGEPEPTDGKLIARNDGRKAGLYIIPGGKRDGDLEVLCMATKSADQRAKIADEFVKQAEATFAPLSERSKRYCQAYLAIYPEIRCAGTGWAAKKGIFDLKHAEFSQLRLFIQELIDIN